MKKIKRLLLFGILTLLGIGSSFSQFYDLRDNTGSQILIPSIGHYSSSPRTRFTFTLGNSDYYSSGYNSYSHGMADIYACYDSSYNVIGFKDQKGLFTFGDVSSCSLSGKISVSTGTANGINTFNYVYIRNDTPISPYSERKNASILRYMYFDFNRYYTSNGYFQDVPDGYRRNNLFLSLAGNYGVVSKNLENGSYLFTSLFDDSFYIGQEFSNVGFLLLHFGGYDTEYYNGAGTLLLALGDDTGSGSGSNSVIYNYYTGFYINYSDISQASPASKGYLTYNNSTSEGYSQFIEMLSSGDSKYKNIILTNGSFPSNQLVFTYYYYNYYLNGSQAGLFTNVGSYNFNFLEYDQVPDFIENSPGIIDNQTISDSLYYYCKGPNYDTSDGLPPAFCYNSNGELDYERFQNCFFTYDVNNDVYHQYCYINGFQQEVVMVEDGSGYSISLGTTYPELDNLGMTGYSEDYFENVLNKTGRFFKCPWVYDNNLIIRPNVINLLNGFDILIPINCGLAGFSHGKNLVSFGTGSHFLESPLLSFEGENRKALYLFFDILISIGIILFVCKIFYLFHK